MLTTRSRSTNPLFAMAVIAVLVSVGTNLAAKGKPKPPTPTPTISYSIAPLGTLGGAWSRATAMNELGDVVGYSETNETVMTSDGEVAIAEPFVYLSNTETMYRLRDLVTEYDQANWFWRDSLPAGINSLGQICMTLQQTDPYASYAVRISLVFDQAGIVIPSQAAVEIVGPNFSGAGDINEFGDVTGQSGSQPAFVYTDEFGYEELPQLGNGNAGGEAINNLGQVTGLDLNANEEIRAFRYTPGFGIEDLGVIESGGPTNRDASYGNDINDSGMVVGLATAGKQKGVAVTHAFREGGSGMDDLGTLGGRNSYAYGINQQGSIVGDAYDANGKERPFLYTNETGMIELEPLITNMPVNSILFNAIRINDVGKIIANIGFTDGSSEACLLTPNE